MSSTIVTPPTFTSAIFDAGRELGARAASRAIAPCDAATHKFTEAIEAPAAALWRQRQTVEAERVMAKLTRCISAAGAVPCGLLSATGLAALLANPVLLPVGALMFAAGMAGVIGCMVASSRAQRDTMQAQRVAQSLDRQLRLEVAKNDTLLHKAPRPPVLRALSQPQVKAVSGPPCSLPGSYPGDFALAKLLLDAPTTKVRAARAP